MTNGQKVKWTKGPFLTFRPLPEGASLHRRYSRGRNGWKFGRRLRRRTDTQEGAGKQSPWEDEGGRRGLEQEELSWTLATALTVTHGGADGGKSHGWGMATDSRGRPTVEEPEAETESKWARGMILRSALCWLVDRGGNWLSVLSGLELAGLTAGRWWAGLWVWSGTGEILLGSDGEQGSVWGGSEGDEALSRTVFGRRRSACDVKPVLIEYTERVIRLAGGVC